MTGEISAQWLVSAALAIAAWLLKRWIERVEAENRELREVINELREKHQAEMDEMKTNYTERFEELKDLHTQSMAAIMAELSKGAVMFAEIKTDLKQIKAACTYIPKPHTLTL